MDYQELSVNEYDNQWQVNLFTSEFRHAEGLQIKNCPEPKSQMRCS